MHTHPMNTHCIIMEQKPINHINNPLQAKELETQNSCCSTAMLNLGDRKYSLIYSLFLLPEGSPKAYGSLWPLVLYSGRSFFFYYSVEPYLKTALKNMLPSACLQLVEYEVLKYCFKVCIVFLFRPKILWPFNEWIIFLYQFPLSSTCQLFLRQI